MPAPRLLQENSTWCADEKLWVWNYVGDSDESTAVSNKLYLDLENPVRVRVEEITFCQPANLAAAKHAAASEAANGTRGKPRAQPTPPPPQQQQQQQQQQQPTQQAQQQPRGRQKGRPEQTNPQGEQPAMKIVAAMDKSGLGLYSWWE